MAYSRNTHGGCLFWSVSSCEAVLTRRLGGGDVRGLPLHCHCQRPTTLAINRANLGAKFSGCNDAIRGRAVGLACLLLRGEAETACGLWSCLLGGEALRFRGDVVGHHSAHLRTCLLVGRRSAPGEASPISPKIVWPSALRPSPCNQPPLQVQQAQGSAQHSVRGEAALHGPAARSAHSAVE